MPFFISVIFISLTQSSVDSNKRVKKQRLKDMEPAYDVLRKLEVALRTNPSTWMEEFCDHPNLGHLVLIEFMEDLPKALEVKMSFPVLQRMAVRHRGQRSGGSGWKL